MDQHWLIMKWDYDYDKEGTWFDHDSGERRYALVAGTEFPLPYIDKKKLEIRSAVMEDAQIKVELCLDGQDVSLCSADEPVLRFVSDNYMVCGDFVSQGLKLLFSIEPK